MSNCEKLTKCAFFNDQLANMPAVADLMKQEFCKGDKSNCARYIVSTAELTVPSDLFPADLNRAQALVRERYKK